MNTQDEMKVETTANSQEVFQFFFSDFGLPTSSSKVADEFASLLAFEALKASKALNYVPMPPITPPRIGWLLSTAIKGAWKDFRNDSSVYEMVRTKIRSNFRSVYEALLAGLEDQVEELIRRPIHSEEFLGFDEIESNQIDIEMTPPASLNQGVEVKRFGKFIHFDGRSSAIDASYVQRNSSQEAVFALCTRQYEEGRVLGIDIGLGGEIAMKGSAELKVKILNELGINNSSIVMLLYARRSVSYFAQNPRFKQGIRYPSPNFNNYYGSFFVSRIDMGAELCVIYNFRCQNETHKNEVLVQLKGEGLFPGGSLKFDASIENKLRKVSLYTNCYTKQTIIGMPGFPIVDPKTADMYAHLNSFFNKETKAPEILDIDLSPYSMVPQH